MGTQKLLFFVLAIFLVIVAIVTGIIMFNAHQRSSNKDAIISDLNNFAADVTQYVQRPVSMGGGSGLMDGYALPARLDSNDNAFYSIDHTSKTNNNGAIHGKGKGFEIGKGHQKDKSNKNGNLRIVGTSAYGFGTVIMEIDDRTGARTFTFTDEFEEAAKQ